MNEKRKDEKPDLSLFRTSLFWDTNINHIDWEKQSGAVIQRVFERGNMDEKKELIRFYGTARIRAALKRFGERKSIRQPKYPS